MIDTDIYGATIDSMSQRDFASLAKVVKSNVKKESKSDDLLEPVDQDSLKRFITQNSQLFVKSLDEFQRNQYKAYASLFEITGYVNVEDVVSQVPGDDDENIAQLGIQAMPMVQENNEFKVIQKLESSDLVNGHPIAISTLYPIFIRFFQIKQRIFMEVTLDKISNKFHNTSNFYQQSIDYIVEWFVSILNFEIVPLDLTDVVNELVDAENSAVKTGQKMELDSGGNATLDAGKNDTFTLPILGDLKNLLSDNSSMFSNSDDTIEIKKLLDEFIDNTEQHSDLPWIALTWPNTVKSKNIKVRFNFTSQTNKLYTLLYFYQTTSERGGMINVEDILINQYCQLSEGTLGD